MDCPKNRAIRSDHKLMRRVKKIEQEICEVCSQLSEELGVGIGWSDARELANGAKLSDLLEDDT